MSQFQCDADGPVPAGEWGSLALDELYNIICDGPRDFESLAKEMKKQGFTAMETKGALEMWAGVYLIMKIKGVVRFLSHEEARETMEKELGQPAPKDILDILITSRPIPGRKRAANGERLRR